MSSDVRDGTRRGQCLVCRFDDVEEFLDLGSTALANKFVAEDELGLPEPRFPLRVGYCHRCGHVQLMEMVPPHAMFDDYLYMSSASETLRTHFDELSRMLVTRFGLGSGDLVVDIGCNDASLLASFRHLGVRTLGVDPARNLAELVRDQGIDRFTGFFGAGTATEIAATWGRAKLVTVTNTFPHLPALDDFVVGIETVLAPGGVLVIEAHYLVDLLDQLAFDTVYHEHVSYWALGPMIELFRRHGLEVVRAERLPIHHGQLRVCVQRAGDAEIDPGVGGLVEFEHEHGLREFETYQRFAERVDAIRTDLTSTLARLRNEGKRVVGYGAPAKGSTLLETLQIGADAVEYIVDRSELKQGRFTPGSHIPIVPTERLVEDRPDFALLLAWNFADEVLAQQQEYRELGGKFIVPVPRVRIV